MITNDKYFDIGVKYGLPLSIIAATLAMSRATGLAKVGVFAISTPLLLLALSSLGKAKKGKLFRNHGEIKMDNL